MISFLIMSCLRKIGIKNVSLEKKMLEISNDNDILQKKKGFFKEIKDLN